MFLYIGGSGWVYSESLKVEKEKFSKRVYLALSLSSPSPSPWAVQFGEGPNNRHIGSS